MSSESSITAWLILNAVNSLELGKLKLVRFLKGSKSKEIFSISQETIFGGLMWYDMATIEGFIDQLEEKNLIIKIKKQGFPYPYEIYGLSDEGKKALSVKAEIQLENIKKIEPVNETEAITMTMIKSGKSVIEVSQERNLAETTIYGHCAKLIGIGLLESRSVVTEVIYQQITDACKRFKTIPGLKEIKLILPEEITYEQIRCVAAEYFNRLKNEMSLP